MAARSVWNVPSRFTPTTRRHSLSVYSCSGLLSPMPALATTSVSPPIASAGRVHRRGGGVRVGDVDGEGVPADLGGDGRRGVAVAVEHGDRGAAAGEAPGGGGADAGAPAGDDGPVPVERLAHRGVQRERGGLDARDHRGAAVHDGTGHREAPPARDDAFEHDRELEPGQRGAEAEVGAVPERHVVVRRCDRRRRCRRVGPNSASSRLAAA